MRVLLINTSENMGGAAIAASRLMNALVLFGIDAKLLVRDKQSNRRRVISVKGNYFTKKRKFLKECLRIAIANRFNKKHLFDVSVANTGFHITDMEEFKKADIIHLHWINQGFISLKELEKILTCGKPIVWTMHDMWAFTGICHMPNTCEKWKEECYECPKLYKGANKRDLSFNAYYQKGLIYNVAPLTIIGCSQWMANQVKKSALLGDKPIYSIPNPLDTKRFSPKDKNANRRKLKLPLDKKLILFSAFRVTDSGKGLNYFKKSIDLFISEYPEMKNKIAVVVVGKESKKTIKDFNIPIYAFNYVNDRASMIDIYRAVDVFAIPTLYDNLPNTIMESMSCAVPVVGFNIGGVSQMIMHKSNGYLSKYLDSKDFAKGLNYVLKDENYDSLSKNARKFALDNYTDEVVAARFYKLYKNLLNAN